MTRTDLILEAARAGLFRVRWTEDIHDEWMRHLAVNRPDIAEKLEKRRSAMDRAVLDPLVTGYRDLIDGLKLPDPDDRHVLAAAIVGRCDIIVTQNLRDFPEPVLAEFNIEVQHPDTFLNHQMSLRPAQFYECVRRVLKRMKKNPKTPVEYIEILKKADLPLVAAELHKVLGLLG